MNFEEDVILVSVGYDGLFPIVGVIVDGRDVHVCGHGGSQLKFMACETLECFALNLVNLVLMLYGSFNAHKPYNRGAWRHRTAKGSRRILLT